MCWPFFFGGGGKHDGWVLAGEMMAGYSGDLARKECGSAAGCQ